MSVISGIMGASAQKSAAKKSAAATTAASDAAAQVQREALAQNKALYLQQRSDFEPYRQIGLSALPQYRAISGLGSSGNDTINQELSPAAKWSLQEATKFQNRQDAARGLSGSGGASARLGELSLQTHAADYSDKYNRILDALKLGTGASQTMGNAGNAFASLNQNSANNLGNISMNQGNTLSNLAIAQGNNAANLYSGTSANAVQGVGVGLKAYESYKNAQAAASTAANNEKLMNMFVS